MKILVTLKRAIDYNVHIQVKPDGTGVETENVKMSMNPFDEIAIEEAVRIKERGECESIIAVSIGELGAQETIRQALAIGADRGLLIQSNEMHEPYIIAQILSQVVHAEKPDLVLMGKQAIDDDCNQTGQILAGMLGWPQATFASKLVCEPERFLVTREVDQGLETIAVNKPAVVTTDLRLNEPRYISLPNILKAKQKPLDIKDVAAYKIDLTPRTQILHVAKPEKKSGGVKFKDAAEFIRCLQEKGVLS